MESTAKSRDGLLRQYLLGALPEAEQDRLEDDLFADEELGQELSLAEDDLIDSYVSGELAGSDRVRFEAHFLASPRRRERVATARAMFASQAAQPASTPSRVTVVSDYVSARRRRLSTWIWPVAAAAAVVVITGAMMVRMNDRLARQNAESARLSDRIERLQRELALKSPAAQTTGKNELLAELRNGIEQDLRRRPSPLPAPALTFALTPAEARRGTTRPERPLLIPSGQHAVQFRLTLSADGDGGYPSYRAAIQNYEGNEVWSQDRLQPSKDPAGLSLTLSVPSMALKPGDYRVMITGVTTSGELQEVDQYFVFHIAAR